MIPKFFQPGFGDDKTQEVLSRAVAEQQDLTAPSPHLIFFHQTNHYHLLYSKQYLGIQVNFRQDLDLKQSIPYLAKIRLSQIPSKSIHGHHLRKTKVQEDRQ
jgi:hypothetical protein